MEYHRVEVYFSLKVLQPHWEVEAEAWMERATNKKASDGRTPRCSPLRARVALSKSRPCDRRAFQCLRGKVGGHVSSSQPYIISLIVVHIYALVRGIKCSSFIAVKSKAYYFCCLLLKVTTLPSFLIDRRHADSLRFFTHSERHKKFTL